MATEPIFLIKPNHGPPILRSGPGQQEEGGYFTIKQYGYNPISGGLELLAPNDDRFDHKSPRNRVCHSDVLCLVRKHKNTQCFYLWTLESSLRTGLQIMEILNVANNDHETIRPT